MNQMKEIKMNKKDLIDVFSFLETDEQKAEMLIELGMDLEESTTDFSNNDIINGCASYVALQIKTNESNTLSIDAKSDSLIVKGLLVVLKIFYFEEKKESIFDFLKQLKIDSILSAQRTNGLKSIIERIENHD